MSKELTQEQKDAALLESVKKAANDKLNEVFAAKFEQMLEGNEAVKAFKAFMEKLENAKTVEAVEKLKDGGEFSALKEAVSKMKAAIEKKHGKKVTDIKKNLNWAVSKGIADLYKKGALTKLKNKELMQATIYTSKMRMEDSGKKVDNPMTDSTSVVPIGTGVPFELTQFEPGLTRVTRRQPIMLDLVDVARTMDRYVAWVEQTNIDTGSAFTTLEGGSQSGNYGSFKWSEFSAKMEKITALSKATREVMDDLQAFQSQVQEEIMELMRLKLDSQVLSGNGTAPNLKGITQYAPGFSNFGNLAVTLPNNYDALVAALLQIRAQGTKSGIAQTGEVINLFNPTDIVLNPVDAVQMELTKDTLGRYVMSLFPDLAQGGKTLGGCRISENILIPQGSYLCMDATKSHVRVRQDAQITLGYVNTDFQDDLITIKGLIRAAHFIKNNQTQAFVFDTFANTKSLIQAV